MEKEEFENAFKAYERASEIFNEIHNGEDHPF